MTYFIAASSSDTTVAVRRTGGNRIDSMTERMSEEAMINSEVLREQYTDDARLTARQSLWKLRAGPALQDVVLYLAALRGSETIADIGCGNGAYVAELHRRGHAGPVL